MQLSMAVSSGLVEAFVSPNSKRHESRRTFDGRGSASCVSVTAPEDTRAPPGIVAMRFAMAERNDSSEAFVLSNSKCSDYAVPPNSKRGGFPRAAMSVEPVNVGRCTFRALARFVCCDRVAK